MGAADIAANNRAFEKAVETGNVEASPPSSRPTSYPSRRTARLLRAARPSSSSGCPRSGYGMTKFQINTEKLDVVGDIASEVGRATMTMAPPGGKSETTAIKYLVVWKRLNGMWLLHRDIYNAIV